MGWQCPQYTCETLQTPYLFLAWGSKAFKQSKTHRLKTLSLGILPDPTLPSHYSFTFKLALLHTFIIHSLCPSCACSWWGLAATRAEPGPLLPLPTPCSLHHVHIPVLALYGVGWLPHAAMLLSLAGCSWGIHSSIVPRHRLNTAGARAFGNCTPRLWNSLTANHTAKHRLQHFSLLKHVRQHSWHLCPFNLTAPCQPRRGKAVLWRRLLPFQLPANTRIGILCPSFHSLSTLSWIMFLLRIYCNSGVTGNYIASLVYLGFKKSKTSLLSIIDLFVPCEHEKKRKSKRRVHTVLAPGGWFPSEDKSFWSIPSWYV